MACAGTESDGEGSRPTALRSSPSHHMRGNGTAAGLESKKCHRFHSSRYVGFCSGLNNFFLRCLALVQNIYLWHVQVRKALEKGVCRQPCEAIRHNTFKIRGGHYNTYLEIRKDPSSGRATAL